MTSFVSSGLPRRQVLRAGLGLAVGGPVSAWAGNLPPNADPETFRAEELVDSGHRFFGTVSRGLALTVEEAGRRWGQPNGYILGQEGSGAFVAGLRYGEGTFYTRNTGQQRVYWQGPSLGFDVGGDGARTMMLVYNLPGTRAVPPLRRHRRLGLFHRRLRLHGDDRRRHRGGADPQRRRRTARRQCRLSEVHPSGDLEPVLRPDAPPLRARRARTCLRVALEAQCEAGPDRPAGDASGSS